MVKNNKLLLVIGQISLVLGLIGFLLNNLVLNHNPTLAFLTGLCIGLSLVMNLAYLIGRK